MTRAAAYRWTFIAAAAAIGCWFVPLVHVRPIGDAEEGPGAAKTLTAAQLAEQFWNGPFAQSRDSAHDAAEVIAALNENPAAAREEYGRTIGVSRAFLLHLRGEGTVRAVERKGVAVDVTGDEEPDLLLLTGPIFGSAVRDATGLLPSTVADSSQQFNEVAGELNLLVEQRVAPQLRDLAEGDSIEFAACAEIKNPGRVSTPIPAVPVFVELP